MTSKEKRNTLQTMIDYINQGSTVDDGIRGKAFEVAIRQYIQPNSKRKGVTPNQRWYGDMLKTVNGSKARFEIKSACGELGIGIDTDINNILTKADFIIYCPEVALNIEPEKQGFVFTRNQFLNMVTSYNGRGKILRIKNTTNGLGYRVSFQSFLSDTRPKASKKISEHIWNCCFEQPTVEEFFN